MLSNVDLDALCDFYSVPLKGIYLQDDLRGRPENGLTILNLDKMYDFDGPKGTHWTCLWCDDSACVYMDSFGAPPPPNIDRWIKTRYHRYGVNAWIIQDVKSSVCGFFCLAFGVWCDRKRLKNEGLLECANRYVNTYGERKNEKVLRSFLLASGLPPHELVVRKCK